MAYLSKTELKAKFCLELVTNALHGLNGLESGMLEMPSYIWEQKADNFNTTLKLLVASPHRCNFLCLFQNVSNLCNILHL